MTGACGRQFALGAWGAPTHPPARPPAQQLTVGCAPRAEGGSRAAAPARTDSVPVPRRRDDDWRAHTRAVVHDHAAHGAARDVDAADARAHEHAPSARLERLCQRERHRGGAAGGVRAALVREADGGRGEHEEGHARRRAARVDPEATQVPPQLGCLCALARDQLAQRVVRRARAPRAPEGEGAEAQREAAKRPRQQRRRAPQREAPEQTAGQRPERLEAARVLREAPLQLGQQLHVARDAELGLVGAAQQHAVVHEALVHALAHPRHLHGRPRSARGQREQLRRLRDRVVQPGVKLPRRLAVDGVAVRAAADDLVLLEHEHAPPEAGQHRRAAQPGHARSDDDHVDVRRGGRRRPAVVA